MFVLSLVRPFLKPWVIAYMVLTLAYWIVPSTWVPSWIFYLGSWVAFGYGAHVRRADFVYTPKPPAWYIRAFDFYLDTQIIYFSTMHSLYKMLRMTVPLLGNYQWTHKPKPVVSQTSKLASALFATPVARNIQHKTGDETTQTLVKTPLPSFANDLDFLDSIKLVENNVTLSGATDRIDSLDTIVQNNEKSTEAAEATEANEAAEAAEATEATEATRPAPIVSSVDSDSEESIHASPREAELASSALAAHDDEQTFADQFHQVETFLAKVNESLDSLVKQE